MSFRDVSLQLTKTLTKEEKQSQGIFFTPKEARDTLFALLARHNVRPQRILEPSFGSGEFIEDLYARFPEAHIAGVEYNQTLFRSLNRPNLYNADFLAHTGTYDLIIGNPPYFVIPRTAETEKCQSNRPNMFVQFIYKSLSENLTPDGVVAFVLPTSLFNCAYYEPLRKYMFETTTILDVVPLQGDYLDTKQKTFALVVRKGKTNDDFFVDWNGSHYISPFYRELTAQLASSRTLADLGYEVKTGEVVWNQHKESLADEGTLLIYSSNFAQEGLTLGGLSLPKKQYIRGFTRPPLQGKTILVNRGYGNTTYALKCVLADYPRYYAENHVNVIKPITPSAVANIEKVLASLRSDATRTFIEMFVGNGALSKTEIQYCLPIDVPV